MNQDNDPLAGAIEPAEPARVLLHMPVDVRSVSLGLLATLASVFVLRWASAVFIPVMVGVLFSYDIAEQPVQFLSYHAIALAGVGLQTGTVQH